MFYPVCTIIGWRAHFHVKPAERPPKETVGFKSIRKAPQIKELDELETRLKSMIRNIEFRPYYSPFQNNLKRDIQKSQKLLRLLYQLTKHLTFMDYKQGSMKSFCRRTYRRITRR